jgi:hypothetical protein
MLCEHWEMMQGNILTSRYLKRYSYKRLLDSWLRLMDSWYVLLVVIDVNHWRVILYIDVNP